MRTKRFSTDFFDIGGENTITTLKEEILSLISLKEKSKEFDIVRKINEMEDVFVKPIGTDALLGKWKLIFANDDITRSSPFFWAFRKAFKDVKIRDPFGLLGFNSFAEGVFKITDSIPVKSIGAATQYITSDQIVSQVEVKVQGLPIEGRSLMTTTSSWKVSESKNPMLWDLQVQKTEVKESSIVQIFPILNQFVRPFPSGEVLEKYNPGSSIVFLKHIYVDDEIRISRNILDDKLFVFEKV